MKDVEILDWLGDIVEGCRNVRDDPNCHLDAKKLAVLVIKDCNKIIRLINTTPAKDK